MTKILLAEDDNDMRQFLTRALKNAGYEVISFDNGRSAYERLREEPFSLLLSFVGSHCVLSGPLQVWTGPISLR